MASGLIRSLFILIFLLIIGNFRCFAQVPDSTFIFIPPDSLVVPSDSLAIVPDSIPENEEVKKNNGPLNSEVNYHAEDSIVYDLQNQQVFIYGEGQVLYETIDLKADRISYFFPEYRVHAEGTPDSTGTLIGTPVFVDGSTSYDSKQMDYNFRSKKGYVKDVATKVSDGYLTGEKVKTTDDNNVVYVKNAEFCPCEDPEANTRFRISKLKMIKDQQIIAGPGYLSIYRIPTPIVFPFGFFPNVDKRQAGILMPSYGDSREYGLFLQNLGFYIPVGDSWDTRFLFDIYTSGSLSVENFSRYARRYKYSGSFNLEYNNFRSGDIEFGDQTSLNQFFIRWGHQQDAKARPDSRFSANVNIGSSQNFRNNLNSSQNEYLTNTFSSRINYTKIFTGTPFTFTASAGHSQNSTVVPGADKPGARYNFTLPETNLSMSRIFLPLSFLRKSNVGRDKWYEKIGLTYNMRFVNQLDAVEDELTLANLDGLSSRFRNGIVHSANMSTNLNAGFVTITPGLNYNERWYFTSISKRFDEDAQQVITDTVPGFRRAADASFNTTVTTKVYGMYTFNGKWLQAVRHTFTPNVNFNLRPDYDPRVYGFYGNNGNPGFYSPFEGALIGQPPTGSSGSLGLSLVNNLEAKTFAPRDTANRYIKMPLIENFSFGSNYNFFADSLNWSPVNFSARTTIKKTITINYSTNLNIYGYDNQGRTINQSLFQQRGRLFRSGNSNLAIGGYLRSKNKGPVARNPEASIPEEELDYIQSNPGLFVDFSVPWTIGFNYNLSRINMLVPGVDGAGVEEIKNTIQSVSFNGDLRLFDIIMISLQSGYDFTNKEITATTINATLDLNCWELSAQFIPFGIRRSYGITLNIKSPMLRDLRLQRRGNLGEESNYF